MKSGCGETTADPSTALRSGRDDKGRVVAYRQGCNWDVWSSGGKFFFTWDVLRCKGAVSYSGDYDSTDTDRSGEAFKL
jgi:hypothetical protein